MPDPITEAGLIRLRNRVTALEANGAELLARAEKAEYDLADEAQRTREIEATCNRLLDSSSEARQQRNQAEARLEHALAELSNLRDHRARWETEKARADKAETRLELAHKARQTAEDRMDACRHALLDGGYFDRLEEIGPDVAPRIVERLSAARDAEAQVAALQITNRALNAAAIEALERAEQAEAAIERAKSEHRPIKRGGITICASCSGLQDGRIRGLIRPHPCSTIAALDAPESPADARTGVSAGVEASGGAGEAQEG